MNMNELKQLVSIYVDGEATPEQEDIILNALKDSEELRTYYQDLLAMSASLQEWPEENLSPDLEQTVRKYISKQEEKKMKKSTLIPVGATVMVAVLALVMGRNYIKMGVQGQLRSSSDHVGEQYRYTPPAQTSQPISITDEKTNVSYGMKEVAKAEVKVDKGQYRTQVVHDGAASVLFLNKKTPTPVRQKHAYKAMPLEEGLKNRSTLESAREGSNRQYEPYYLSTEYDLVEEEIGPVQPFLQIHQAEDQFNTEQYDLIQENEFLNVTANPLSTFSIDVDTASYTNLRRFLNSGQTPPVDSVRIEEMVNYFVYDYPQPQGEDPFSVNVEMSTCPWNQDHQLAMIGLQGKLLDANTIPQSNLVFLIDVSGSMSSQNKLPLLKQGFKMMVNQLRPEERVSIVTYAGSAGIILDSVSGGDKQQILSAIDRLQSGGSTAGAQGILTAYELAKKNLIPGGNNRVILATDGDFNIGVSSDSELVRIIEKKRQDGIFLTILGFGMGNYKDGKMEKLADKGNGNYYYIDTEREAKKVMVRELSSTLFTIAKNVKLQIEFNPAQVKAYRLIGYENRKLNKEDFNDDTKDAGELGAGHTVTAFYEIIPASNEEEINKSVDALKYQEPVAKQVKSDSNEIMTVKLRYKKPDENVSKLISRTVTLSEIKETPSENFHFASAVAEFGMLLRNSKFKGQASFQSVLQRANNAKGSDQYGYRQEFIDLVEKAQTLVPETYSTGYGVKGVE